MAFRQPTVAAPRSIQPAPLSVSHTPVPIRREQLQESQEWVIFSPVQAQTSPTDSTQSISNGHTSQTAGLSRVSDFGSLRTNIRSGHSAEELSPQDDDVELDSLDDGLHAFREPTIYRGTAIKGDQTDGTVLPAHDGLGSFHASSSTVQEQLWQYEQHNPKRKFEGQHHRRSSVQRRLGTIEEVEARNIDEDRRIRIESWRLDQSRALLDEIEKETRRMDRRQTFLNSQVNSSAISEQLPAISSLQTSGLSDTDAGNSQDDEPFWRSITRRFIRDFIGIDESLLTVIFGETLPEEALDRPPGSAQLPGFTSTTLSPPAASSPSATWRDRLVRRIARELGVLVEQLSAHPGAFSARLHNSTSSSDYAGMPTTEPFVNTNGLQPLQNDNPSDPVMASPTSTPSFHPTLNYQPRSPDEVNAASWGLEDEASRPFSPQLMRHETSSSIPISDSDRAREYWERDLDFKMVFGYFKERFAGSGQPAHTPSASQDPVRRAAIIRQHHPLVARNHTSSSRVSTSRLTSHHIYHGLRRPGSSCASLSVRSSQKDRGSLVRSGRGSSRNYWDIGGSLGSGGSGVLSTGGGMGAWGEV
ncbi:MAG: hypothetical protein Q9160_002046 [Pyrenula sp. 1 TL-2023]